MCTIRLLWKKELPKNHFENTLNQIVQNSGYKQKRIVTASIETLQIKQQNDQQQTKRLSLQQESWQIHTIPDVFRNFSSETAI